MLPDYYNCVLFLLLSCCSLLLWTSPTASSAAIMGDECDWLGSGLATSHKSSSSSGRGVTPVYLRCTSGHVTWQYPRGALRVLLRLPGQDREFRACIRLRPDVGHKEVPARLFLEGPRSLLPLYADDDEGGVRRTRCFNSKHHQLAIYVEAGDEESVQKRVAEFEYDLQALPRGAHAFDPTEECRPCTSDELAHAFCTSDLVTRGTIRGIESDDEAESSQMAVKITKLIRHTTEDGYEPDENGVVNVDDVSREVMLTVGHHCGVAHGTGEFVFMARRKLGELTLKCAPRLEDWAQLVHTLTEEDRAHCVLRS